MYLTGFLAVPNILCVDSNFALVFVIFFFYFFSEVCQQFLSSGISCVLVFLLCSSLNLLNCIESCFKNITKLIMEYLFLIFICPETGKL